MISAAVTRDRSKSWDGFEEYKNVLRKWDFEFSASHFGKVQNS